MTARPSLTRSSFRCVLPGGFPGLEESDFPRRRPAASSILSIRRVTQPRLAATQKGDLSFLFININ